MRWHDAVVSELHFLMLRKEIQPFSEGKRVRLTASFIHSDRARRDSDNQLSSILDTLVDAGILPDDNWKVVPEKHIYDSYEKGNARCEIVLEEMD